MNKNELCNYLCNSVNKVFTLIQKLGRMALLKRDIGENEMSFKQTIVSFQQTMDCKEAIEAQGLTKELNKHIAYYAKLRRKGVISDEQYHQAYVTTHTTLAGVL